MQATLAAPFGAVRVTVDADGLVRGVGLAERRPEPDRPGGFPDRVEAAFEAYLEGQAPRPEVPVGAVNVTAFQRAVLTALTDVEPGSPVTYGELAARIGKPKAARAVGQALRANPLALVWPCHRVVAADGLGGFGGASSTDREGKLTIKRWLLDHEQRIAEQGLAKAQAEPSKPGR
jgi:methylated-DNA-[protein]-cysteine S-methyltransferase